jgi:membrane fusion protein, multidrug efflux system
MSDDLFLVPSLLPRWMRLSQIAWVLTLPLVGCNEPPSVQPVPPRPVNVWQVSDASHAEASLLTGEIAAHEETELGFRINGRIQRRLVDVGQTVSPGDTLATLDPTDTETQYRIAQASLVEARSSAQLAAMTDRRMSLLAPKGAISRVQLDEARANRDTAAARLEGAQSTLKNAHNQLGYTRLLSPMAGVVTGVTANTGQVVGAGQTVLRLASAAGSDAVFNVPSALLGQLRTQKSICIRWVDDPAVTTRGTLRDISPQADVQTRTWRVRYTLDQPPEEMAMGATVIGMVPTTGEQTFQVPASALTRTGDQPALFIVDHRTNTLHLTAVLLADYTAESVLIKRGLHKGDWVVTAGVSQLHDGEKVSVEMAK